ncbi:MAG: HAMP domain-containing histidine kinase [Treponema sp.]|nr:HAMP domain-containing histidine kinase [Treponema sp.]
MRNKQDSRVNASHGSLKEYAILFFVLAAFNGFHMWIYQVFEKLNLFETNAQLAINIMILYIMAAAALVMASIAIIRFISWNRPMRSLSEAARKIAKGDFSVRIAPLRKDGKKDFVEVMFDDFNTMAEELSTIETLKNDFIANVSHEIKTPLSIIQNYTTALQNNTMQEVRIEYIQTILETTKKLSELVTNILKLNKLENQEIAGEAKQFNLSEQIRRCALAFADLMEQKNICFEEDLDEVTVCYDAPMLEIVWNNLLSNAVKFTNPGGSIFISLKTLNGSKNNFVQVSFTDTGCGMDEITRIHVFDKFYQGDTSHSGEGNGLGLALVKKTIDLLGGAVTAESTPGHGSTFTICLPV